MLLLVCLMAMSYASLLGGKRGISITIDDKVKAAALFAASEIEQSTSTTVNVVSGTEQLVAGTLYDLKVQVTGPLGHCRVFQIKVGAQPWKKPAYTLYEHHLLDETC